MPFIRRNPSRRWLQNRPTLPLTSFGRSLRTEVYYNDYYGGDYYQNIQEESYDQQASTITGRTLSDLGISPGIETFEPISFINLDEQISLSPGKTLYFYLDRVVKGSRPLRYYLLKHPDWIRLDITKDGQVVTGTAPLTSAHVVDISVLVENNMGQGVLDFKITLEGFILTDSLGNILRDELSQVVESHIFDIVDEPFPTRPPLATGSLDNLEIISEPVEVDIGDTIAEYDVSEHLEGATEQRSEEVSLSLQGVEVSDATVDPIDPESIQLNDGVVSWKPSRNFLRDAFAIRFRAAAPAVGGASVYGETTEVIDVTTIITTENVISGDPDASAEYIINQFNTGTCFTSAIGTAFHEKGVTGSDYQVIQDTTLVIGPDGTPLNTPRITDARGNAPYTVRLQTQEQVELYQQSGITHEFLMTFSNVDLETERQHTIWPSANYHPQVLADGSINRSGSLSQAIGDFYGNSLSGEIFADISTIISHLNAGNQVLMQIDQSILRNSSLVDQITSNEDTFNPTAHTSRAHMITITGVVRSPEGEIQIVINDSSGRPGEKISAEEFFAASSGYNFSILATGERMLTTEEVALQNDAPMIEKSWSKFVVNQYRLNETYDTPEEAFEAEGLLMVPRETILEDVANIGLSLEAFPSDTVDPFAQVLASLAQADAANLRAFPAMLEALGSVDSDIPEYFDRIDEVREQELLGMGFTQEELDALDMLQETTYDNIATSE